MDALGIPSAVWLPIATLIPGVFLNAIFDALKDGRAGKREREARREARSDALRLKRIEFQRENLLALQDAIAKLTRTTGSINHSDIMRARETGKWVLSPGPHDLSEDFTAHRGLLARLQVRIQDDEIRELSQSLGTTCVNVIMSQSHEEAQAHLNSLYPVLQSLTERIGEVLRSLDRDEEAV